MSFLETKKLIQIKCPIHPDFEVIFLRFDMEQQYHLQCSECVSLSSFQNLMNLKELILPNDNTIIRSWPIKDNKEMYDKLIEISQYKDYTQKLHARVSAYFKQLRFSLEKKLKDQEEYMMEQSKSLVLANQNTILQYNKVAAKEELKNIILYQNEDFEQQNKLLREQIFYVLSKQESAKQSLADALSKLEFQENRIQIEIPKQIKNEIAQLIEKIGKFNKEDVQNTSIVSSKHSFNSYQDKRNNTKPSEMTTSQLMLKLMSNKMNNCSKQLIDNLQTIISKVQNQIDQFDVNNCINKEFLDIDLDNLDEKQFEQAKSYIKSLSEKSKSLSYNKLIQDENCIISKQLASKETTAYFEGQFINPQGVKQDCVFKIQSSQYLERYGNEIDILKSFDGNINIVRFINAISNLKSEYNVIVLDKCQYSLKNELNQAKNKNISFNLNMLLKIIFDCLDGLISLKINEVVHFNIKPNNILKTFSGKYCISDFAFSHKRTFQNYEFKSQGQNSEYTPKEQILQSNEGYHCDIYSMGMTLLEVLEAFQFANKDLPLQLNKTIKNFKDIIQNNMVVDDFKKRNDCLEIQNLFFQNSMEYKEFFSYYLEQIEEAINNAQKAIDKVSPNKNKITFKINKLFKIHYLKIKFQIIQNDSSQSRSIMNCQKEMSACYEDIKDYKNSLTHWQKLIECTKIYQNNDYSETDLREKEKILDLFYKITL